MAYPLIRALLVAGMATAAASANAYDWQDMVFVSSTMGNHAGRLCASGADATKLSDIGCLTYAPSLTTAGDVSVTGAVQATRFLGDGSGLTGLAAASDNIASGTTNVTVNVSTR